jgi:hypothetical protein
MAVAQPILGGVPRTIVPARAREPTKSAPPCFQPLKDAHPAAAMTNCRILLQVSKGDNCTDPREINFVYTAIVASSNPKGTWGIIPLSNCLAKIVTMLSTDTQMVSYI